MNKKKLRSAIFWAFVIALAIFPRVYKLGKDFHGIDSDRWFRRSVAFQDALLKGDFAKTYQKQHPGATLMWLGGMGYKIVTSTYAKLNKIGLDENIPQNFEIINLSIKLPLVIADLLLIFTAYFLIKKLKNRTAALVFITLLLIDPFFLFYTRQFHLDALMSLFLVNSTIAFGIYLKGGKTCLRYLALSGIFASLAFLTKSPSGAFILAFGFSIIVFDLIKRNKARTVAKHLIIFGAACLATYLSAFPANWANPIWVMRQILVDSLTNAKEGNVVHLFGNACGKSDRNFYLLIFLFRFSAFLVAGTVASIIINIKKVPRHLKTIEPLLMSSGFLALAVLIFLESKFYERYAVAFVPGLTLFTALTLSNYIKEKQIKVLSIIVLVLFSMYSFKKYPNYATWKTLFISEDTQLTMFSEMGACESNVYEIAQFLNSKEPEGKYQAGVAGVYRLCIKPFLNGRVANLNEDRINLKYYILYKTDTNWLTNRGFLRKYKLVKTFYISKTPTYYIYERSKIDGDDK